MAPGVSSTMSSTPVAVSSARMLRPSRPMMRPFISSLGRSTTDTVVSMVCSAALRWMASVMICCALAAAVSRASASRRLTRLAASRRTSASICFSRRARAPRRRSGPRRAAARAAAPRRAARPGPQPPQRSFLFGDGFFAAAQSPVRTDRWSSGARRGLASCRRARVRVRELPGGAPASCDRLRRRARARCSLASSGLLSSVSASRSACLRSRSAWPRAASIVSAAIRRPRRQPPHDDRPRRCRSKPDER